MRLRVGVAVGVLAVGLVTSGVAPALAGPTKTSGSTGNCNPRKSVCASEPTDTTAPSVSVSSPTGGATVSGTITVNGVSSDDNSISRVEVSVDGGAWAVATGTTSWARSLDTTVYADGQRTIAARATDAAGNSRTTSVTVNFANAPAAPAPDTTAPAAAVTTPQDGSTVDAIITVSGTASDNVGVARVELSVDGGGWSLATGTTTWSRAVDTSGWAPGSTHTIGARSIDGSGNASPMSSVAVVKYAPPASNGAPDTQGTWTSPEGVRIEVATAGPWTIRSIYDRLVAGAPMDLDRIGPNLTIKVQDTSASQTVGSGSTSGGVYTTYRSTIYLKGINSGFASRPDDVLHHEYGHAWMNFHLYVTHQGDLMSYVRARGLEGDPRLGSTYTWSVDEIAADDYRLLFGSSASISQRPTHMNSEIAHPDQVAGLRNFLLTAWRGR